MFCCTNKRLLLLIVLGFAALLGLAYVFQWQPVLVYAPYLLILLCPLMHVFMMKGHKEEHPVSPKTARKGPSCHG